MRALLKAVFDGKLLSRAEARSAMGAILQGEGRPEQIAAFLAALHVRGESRDELSGFLDSLRELSIPVPAKREKLFDTCGTGGDGAQTFNISTAAAFVLAACGVPVAKHGNRSVSSRSGSADVLEALGIRIDATPEITARNIDTLGFGFLFAPLYHPALSKVAPIRRALEVRTVFNVLGPLANPARVRRQVMGVYDVALLERLAELLRESGTEEAMVVASEDGLDEITLGGTTRIAHLKGGEIRLRSVQPEDFGLARAPVDHLKGGDARENAKVIERILAGEETGAKRDVVLANASAALFVAGVASDFRDGVIIAKEAIVSGRASRVLTSLKEVADAA